MHKKNLQKNFNERKSNYFIKFIRNLELSKLEIFLSLVVLLISFYLRVEPAIFNISHFSFDQGLDQILVKKLVVDKDITLVSRYSGLEGVFMGPLFTWIMAIPFYLSNGNPNANVIFLSLLGLLSTVITYLVVKQISSKPTALIASFLTAISPIFVSSSKNVLSPSPLVFLTVIHVYLLWLIIIRKSKWLIPILAFFLSILFQFEIGYALFSLFATGLLCLIYLKLSFLKPKIFIPSILAFVIPFLPQIVFDIRNYFIISRSILGYINGTNTSLGKLEVGFLGRIISRIETLVEDLVTNISFGDKYQFMSLLMFAALFNGLIILYQSKKTTLKKTTTFLLLFVSFVYGGFILYSGPVWSWYRAGLPFIFVLLLSIALSEIWSQVRWGKFIVGSIVVLLSIIAIGPQDRISIARGKYAGYVSTLSNQQKALDYIYKDSKGEPFALYVYTPPVYPWIWDYQLWWYAEKKYGYLPSPYDRMPQEGNPELIYLIIEPAQFEADMLGWKDNFTHYGEMTASASIPGGIGVEKWAFTEDPQNTDALMKYVDIFDEEGE